MNDNLERQLTLRLFPWPLLLIAAVFLLIAALVWHRGELHGSAWALGRRPRQNRCMGKVLDEAKGRRELRDRRRPRRCAVPNAGSARPVQADTRLSPIAQGVGRDRSRRDAPVSLPFRWAGHLEVALGAVDEAIRELRTGSRLRRRD